MLKENQGTEMGNQGTKMENQDTEMGNHSVEAAFQKRRQEVEDILNAFLPEEKGPAKTGIEAMNYSLMVGGKRIRPILLREAFLLFAGEERRKLFIVFLFAMMTCLPWIMTSIVEVRKLPGTVLRRPREYWQGIP